jgi:hypothetical protein
MANYIRYCSWQVDRFQARTVEECLFHLREKLFIIVILRPERERDESCRCFLCILVVRDSGNYDYLRTPYHLRCGNPGNMLLPGSGNSLAH